MTDLYRFVVPTFALALWLAVPSHAGEIAPLNTDEEKFVGGWSTKSVKLAGVVGGVKAGCPLYLSYKPDRTFAVLVKDKIGKVIIKYQGRWQAENGKAVFIDPYYLSNGKKWDTIMSSDATLAPGGKLSLQGEILTRVADGPK